jgi:class 3 adenylate cyclase
VSVGDVVEAAGFADIENFLPVLQDAVFRRRPNPGGPDAQGRHDAGGAGRIVPRGLVTLQGKLLDRFVRQDRQPTERKMRVRTVLMMQSENLTFTAETEAPEAMQDLAALPVRRHH